MEKNRLLATTGRDYDPALKMKRVPRVVPPISFLTYLFLPYWTRPSSSVEGHKFHRWNFRTSPFIWFSRKKWSGRCSPDPCLHPSHPSSSPPPPIATLEPPETGVTAKFQILVPFSRVFNTRGGKGHPLLVKNSSSRIRMWEMVGNFVSTFQLRWRRK